MLVLKHAKPRFDHETLTDILLELIQTCERASTPHFECETLKRENLDESPSFCYSS